MDESAPPPRILLLGITGRLGAAMHEVLGRHSNVTCLARKDLDLSHLDEIERVLDRHEFDLLINCAANTFVDICEEKPTEARLVNATAPGIIAKICAARKVRMLHFSTDYVFDGESEVPYTEADTPSPRNVYGSSKLRGEDKVLEASADHAIFRLSWVFGPHKVGFPDWVVESAKKQSELKVVADKVGCPTYTMDCAAWLWPFIERPELPGGVYHLCNSEPTSWLDWAQCCLDEGAEYGLPLRVREAEPQPLSALPHFKAHRPRYTAMDTSRFHRVTGLAPRSWRGAVRDWMRLKYPLPVTSSHEHF